MATYILIAGAWHGSWCWSEVSPLLERAGHRVLTPDLRGMADGEIVPISDPIGRWADQIADIVIAQQEPVILVGHSRAGLVISEVAERVPEQIGLLVYLSAMLLKAGQTASEIGEQAQNHAAFAEAMIFADDGTCSIRPEAVRALFYSNTPDRLVDIAQGRLRPEPSASFVTTVQLTEQRFGSVARAYIECRQDQAIPLATQKEMQRAVPVRISEQLDSDHSPFFSQPTELAEALERVRRAV